MVLYNLAKTYFWPTSSSYFSSAGLMCFYRSEAPGEQVPKTEERWKFFFNLGGNILSEQRRIAWILTTQEFSIYLKHIT